jgi:hypothetical protein
VPTFPFTLPTGGAEPLCVSQLKPEKVNSLGPTTEAAAPEDPVLEVPLPEVPVLEVPVPEVPVPEVVDELVPEEPVLEVPVPEVVEEVVPEDPLLEEPLPELVVELAPELLPDDPLWAGWNGIVPPPHPARKRSANNRTLALSMKIPPDLKNRGQRAGPLWPAGMRRRRSQISDSDPETSLPARPGAIPSGAPT